MRGEDSRRMRLEALILCLLMSACPAGHLARATDGLPCALEPGPKRAIVGILDSETLALDDGSEVRLVGALAPRLADGAGNETAWPPERDAKAELERVAAGKSVELYFAGRRVDRYGRTLAHVFVDSGDDRIWLQEHMLRNGHARAYALPDSAACLDELRRAERAARDRRAGLWANAAYQVRQADKPHELYRFQSSYQIVEGRVARVADVRGQIFLNFGSDWRNDFTAAVRPARRRAFSEAGINLKALEGKHVLVRGWIERRSGPSIDLYHPAQIEVLDD
jgi:micrococcal nuclease